MWSLIIATALAAEPFEEAWLQATAERLRPLIERHAGRPFRELPKVEMAATDAFSEAIVEESRVIYDQVFKASPPEVRRRLAEDAARGAHLAVAGKYGIFTETVYLSEAPIRAIAAGLGEDRVADVATVVLAHELAHALQDQHTPLRGLLDVITDQDQLWAASGSWEGFAGHIEEQVADELGLTDVTLAMARMQGWGPKGLEQPLAFKTWATYGQGRRFVEHHVEKGGVEQLWRVLAAPPDRTAMLFRPEAWVPDRRPAAVDFEPALRGVEQKLTSKVPWASLVTTVGELELREEAIHGQTAAALDALMVHLRHGQKLAAVLPDRQVEARVMWFDDASWSKRYLELLRAQADGLAKSQTSRDPTRDVSIVYEPFTMPEGVLVDDATLRTLRVPIGGGRHRESRAVWVARGPMVVVVSAEQFRPGLRLGWAVDHVLRGLDQVTVP